MDKKIRSILAAVTALFMCAFIVPTASANTAPPAEDLEVYVDGQPVGPGFTVKEGQSLTVKYKPNQANRDYLLQIDPDDHGFMGFLSLTKQVDYPALNGKLSFDYSYTGKAGSIEEGYEDTQIMPCLPYRDMELQTTIARGPEVRIENSWPFKYEGTLCVQPEIKLEVIKADGTKSLDLNNVKYGDTVRISGTLPKEHKLILGGIRPEGPIDEDTFFNRYEIEKEIGKSTTFTSDLVISCDAPSFDPNFTPVIHLNPEVTYKKVSPGIYQPFITVMDNWILDNPTEYNFEGNFTVNDDYANCANPPTVPNPEPGPTPAPTPDTDPVIKFFDSDENNLIEVTQGEELIISFENAPEGSVGSATLHSNPINLGSTVIKDDLGRLKATVPCTVEPGKHTIKAAITAANGQVIATGEREVMVLKSAMCEASKPKPDPKPAPKPNPKGAKLADTGSDALALATWALGLSALGALALRRRTTN